MRVAPCRSRWRSPGPDISRQYEADLQVFRPQSLTGEQAGKADNIAGRTVGQNSDSCEAIAEGEEFSHHLFGSFLRHWHSLKNVTHHIAVTQDPLVHARNVLFGGAA